MMSDVAVSLPVRLSGPVVRGFGRGSRLLGFPTANIPPEPHEAALSGLPLGVYFGWAAVHGPPPPHGATAHPMAMSVGQNPFFHNEAKTIEVHVLHDFPGDFYGCRLDAVVVGYLRPMRPFASLDELKAAIQADCDHARAALAGRTPPPFPFG